MKKIVRSLTLIMILISLMTTQSFAQKQNIIAGDNRFETAVEISKTWKNSKEVILVNSTSTSDMLCATTLASQKQCPILLTYKNSVGSSTIKELKRLEVEKVYIIGGEKVITPNIEKEINNINLSNNIIISTERISGKDRYETSLKIADLITNSDKNNKVEQIVVVNGREGIVDAISISSVAGTQNMPIILSKQNELGQAKEWIDKQNIKTSYIIGGESSISSSISDNLLNTIRIHGSDRYETNAKIIDTFYKSANIETIFYCKGSNIKDNTMKEDLVDGILITPLASKQNSPIVVLGDKLNSYQEEIISKKSIKSLIQVGNGVSEQAKAELYKAKENYKEPTQPENPKPPIKPDPPEIIPPTELDPPIDKMPPQYKEHTINSDKKIITITFDEKLDENINDIKSKIKILIDENSIESVANDIQNLKNHYIKLNKYDEVSIDGVNLIIHLDDELIGLDSEIVIEGNSIKDKNENIIQEEITISNIEGANKSIAFVKTEDELRRSIENTSVNIIKICKDIQIIMYEEIVINRDVIIDGSNGEGNYTINAITKEWKPIKINQNDMKLKNLNIIGQQGAIEVLGAVNIKLENMKIECKNPLSPAISIIQGVVKAKDLEISVDDVGIKLWVEKLIETRSQIILNGAVYNINKNNDGVNYPSIQVDNNINDEESENVNKIMTGENVSNDYIEKNYTYKVEFDDQVHNKKSEIYY